MYVTSAAAGYNLLQLCKHSTCSRGNLKGSDMCVAWISLFLDQVSQLSAKLIGEIRVCVKIICEQIAAYITFGTNTASVGASMIAVKGSEAFQWIKVCDKFTRFCIQIGGAFLCGYVASILMLLISTISAYRVFRMYSPKWFLRLKTT